MSRSSVFSLFGTDKDLEKAGVWVNYGDVRFKVARSGGANVHYAELLRKKIKPVQHQIDRGTLPKDEDDRISAELFAESVIKAVQVKKDDTGDGEWVDGVPTSDGKVLPVTKANVVKLLLELPDMFRDIKVCANDAQKYQNAEEEADLKNSSQS